MADELPKDAAGARNPFEQGFEPAAARPAATILLLRRGGKHSDRRLEVLLVKRHEGARFMPGVWVFPGGRVEADELITGVSGAETDVDADELAHRAAAIRELAEEAGIQLDLSSELVPWSRWITPEPIPTRFDTRFYLALAPAHSPPKADGQEVTDAAWMNPQDALERGRGGRDRARLPHDQAARVAGAVRDRRRGDGRRPRAGRRADHAERRRGRLRAGLAHAHARRRRLRAAERVGGGEGSATAAIYATFAGARR